MLDDPSSYLSRLDDSYPSCIRTCAKLQIYPHLLRHERVSEMLGIVPTEGCNVGDQKATRFGGTRTVRLTYWMLSSEDIVPSLDVRKHVDWLLDRIEPAASALRELQHQPGLRMTVNCPWWSRGGHGGPILWPSQMRRLAALNLECGFEVQFYPDDEEGPETEDAES